jgi:hypothetical protein
VEVLLIQRLRKLLADQEARDLTMREQRDLEALMRIAVESFNVEQDQRFADKAASHTLDD